MRRHMGNYFRTGLGGFSSSNRQTVVSTVLPPPPSTGTKPPTTTFTPPPATIVVGPTSAPTAPASGGNKSSGGAIATDSTAGSTSQGTTQADVDACRAKGGTWIGIASFGSCQTPQSAEKALNEMLESAVEKKTPAEVKKIEDFVQKSCLERGGSYENSTCYITTPAPSAALPSDGAGAGIPAPAPTPMPPPIPAGFRISPVTLALGGVILYLFLRKRS